jgi:4-hydroxy-2-oxoheptanedioate aldolase
MRENAVKRLWQQDRPALGGWLMIPSGFSAEVMAHQNLDWLCIDMQHGLIDYDTALAMLQAISTTATTPFVRVPWNDSAIIMKMLDAGAYGVIVPMVNSRAEAEAAVAACRYPPQGIRSFGPIRAVYYAGLDYFAYASQEVSCIPQIETTAAVENLDEILSVEGVDAVYIGPMDLSISLGLPMPKRASASWRRAGATTLWLASTPPLRPPPSASLRDFAWFWSPRTPAP